MAKYTVTERSFINNRLVEPGEVVEYDGEAAENLSSAKRSKRASADEPVSVDDTSTVEPQPEPAEAALV